MTTPCTNCLIGSEYSNVYPPSEDSFLFLDALELERTVISKLNPTLSVEVGSGSGIISSFYLCLQQKPMFHICIDVSPIACLASQSVIKHNVLSHHAAYDVLNCSLMSPFLPRLCNMVDLILFNPPYVPTSDEEHNNAGSTISASWSGGLHGRQVIDRFLKQAIELLSPTGCLYLLLSDDNYPEEVHALVKKWSNGSLDNKRIIHRRVHNEFLSIYRYMNHDLIST